jgi:hypothetical protein
MHPVSSRVRGIKTSLYADDTTIFMSPIKQDKCQTYELICRNPKSSGLDVQYYNWIKY